MRPAFRSDWPAASCADFSGRHPRSCWVSAFVPREALAFASATDSSPATSRHPQLANVRWGPGFSPARDLMSIHDDMNRLFDSFGQGTSLQNGGAFAPAIDIEE